jgi:outer membrane immunogenic protein
MRKYLLAALLAGTVASPALAQSAAPGPFTGARVEAILGYDSLGFSGEDDVDDIGGDDSLEGLVYGVGVGFDFDAGGVVVGAEAELSDSTGSFDFEDEDFEAGLDTGRDIYIGGRLGFTVTPSTLLYAKAGYTNLKLEADLADEDEELGGSGDIDGYRLGAGAEFLFGTNAYGKVEYRYSNYGSYGDDDLFGEIDVDRHQFVAGVGIRF